jgi:hypothetical protein
MVQANVIDAAFFIGKSMTYVAIKAGHISSSIAHGLNTTTSEVLKN